MHMSRHILRFNQTHPDRTATMISQHLTNYVDDKAAANRQRGKIVLAKIIVSC